MRRNALAPLFLGALLFVSACDREEPGEVSPPADPVTVEVSQPASRADFGVHTGTLVSLDEADLATRTSGTVEEVLVDVGSSVRKGEVLLRLDDTSTAAQLDAAQAGLRQARRRFERIEALAADGAATQQELDDARAGWETAQAQVASARSQQSYVELRAPFDGYVTARFADRGDLAAPARPLLSLARTDSLKVVTDLPGEVAGALSPGDPAAVVLPDGRTRLAARVVRISPALDRASRRARVELLLDPPGGVPAPDLRPGAFVRVEIEDSRTRSLWIPADALVRRGQLRGVFAVEGPRLRLRWIRIGEDRPDAIEILAGLDGDARLVRRPDVALVDGTPVEGVTEREWPGPSREGVQ